MKLFGSKLVFASAALIAIMQLISGHSITNQQQQQQQQEQAAAVINQTQAPSSSLKEIRSPKIDKYLDKNNKIISFDSSVQPELVQHHSNSNSNLNQNQSSLDLLTNEIDDDAQTRPYLLPEPVKTIVQATTRFALAQTSVTRHLTIDGAMSILNDAFYLLARPAVLVKVMKFFSAMLASSLGASLFMPELMDIIWRRPPTSLLQLDSHLYGNLIESRAMHLTSPNANLITTSDLQESENAIASCHEKSVRYLSETLDCMMPQTSRALICFVRNNFASSLETMRSHGLGRAFASGFKDYNCTLASKTTTTQSKRSTQIK